MVLLFRAGTFLARHLPERAAGAIGRALADLGWAVLRARRRTVEGNVRRLAPNASPEEQRRLVRSTFRNFAVVVADFFRFPVFTPQAVLARIDWTGLEPAEEVARRRGVLLVTAHLGHPELAAINLLLRGNKGRAVVEQLPEPIGSLKNRYRTALGGQVIVVGDAGIAAVRAIRRGESLVLAGDRAVDARAQLVTFASGRRLSTPGPAMLAVLTRAPVVIFYVVIDTASRPPRYRGVVEPPIWTDTLTAADVPSLTQQINDRLARAVEQYPDQWFVFQPDWLPNGEEAVTIPCA